MLSYVTAAPEALAAAAGDLTGIGEALRAATAAAAPSTTSLVAAAGDEVSTAIATLFSEHAQSYQALSAQMAAFHDRFMNALAGASGSYASAEAANVTPLQTIEQDLLGAVNAPTQVLFGRGLIGDGANGTAPGQAGGAGGLLIGNGGNGGPRGGGPRGGGGGGAGVVGHRGTGGGGGGGGGAFSKPRGAGGHPWVVDVGVGLFYKKQTTRHS